MSAELNSVATAATLPALEWQKGDTEGYFRILVEKWLAERGPTSLTTKMVLHPAYQQIVGMGPQALPYIFREMQRRPGHWFWALRAITGVDPVREEIRGNIPEMTKCWLEWATNRGYI